MKIFRWFFCLLFFTTFLKSFAQVVPVLEWADSFNGGDNPNSGNSVAVDGLGNVYTTGKFRSSTDFNPGPKSYSLTSGGYEDCFVTKLDSKGNFLWAKQIGIGNGAEGNSIKVDPFGDILVSGTFQGTTDFDPGEGIVELTPGGASDAFILKLTADGDFIWAKNLGGPKSEVEESFSLDCDTKGNVYTTGRFSWSADFDPGKTDFILTATGTYSVFVSKLDMDGNFLWAKNLDGANATGQTLLIGNKGDVYVGGNFTQGMMDFDPGSKVYPLTASGFGNGFLVKLTTDGNFVWANKIGETGSENISTCYSLAADVSDNLVVTGYFDGQAKFDPNLKSANLTSNGNKDIYIASYNTSGAYLWAKNIGGIADDNGFGVDLDKSGNILATGSFYGSVDFDPGTGVSITKGSGDDDIFVLKLDGKGNFIWVKTLIGGKCYGVGITADDAGFVYNIGNFSGGVDYNPGRETFILSSINENAYILKLSTSNPNQITITTQPENDTVCNGSQASFFIGTQNESDTYQWQVLNKQTNSFEDLTDGNGIQGANTSNVFIDTKSNLLGIRFRSVVTNFNKLSTISDTVSLVFLPNPDITTKVFGDTVCYNENYAYVKIPNAVKGNIYTAYFTNVQGFTNSSTDTARGGPLNLRFIVESLGGGTKPFNIKVKNKACEAQLADTARISVFYPPTNNTTFTGSTICEGTDSAVVTLTGTEFGASYRAFIKGNVVSNFIKGTGKIDNLFLQTNKLSSGSYIVNVEASNTGCTIMLSDTAALNILAAPTGIAFSNSPVCQNGLISLGVSQVVKGYTYLWTGPNKFSSTSANSSVISKTIGKEIYNLEITGNNKCKKQDALTIIINIVPVLNSIVGQNTVCQEVSYNYSTDSIKGAIYSWYFKKTQNQLKSTSSRVKYLFPDNASSDTLVVSANLNGCNSVPKQLSIAVNSTPKTIKSIDSLKICAGDSVTLTSTFKGAVYNWTFAQKTVSTNQSVKVGPLFTPGKYRYIVSLSIGSCTGDNDTTEITVLPKPNASFTYSNNSYCEGMPDASPIKVPVGSNFTSNSTSLSLNKFTGLINFGQSKPGTYLVRNSITTNGCTSTDSVNINYSLKPAALTILGACQKINPPVLLSVSGKPTAPSVVTWLFNKNVVSNADTFTAKSTGVYSVVVTNTISKCSSDTSSVDPFIKKPKISAFPDDTSFCLGDSVRLISNSPSGNSWKGSAFGNSLGKSQSIIVKNSGKFYLDITNGNCSGRDSINLVFNNKPFAGSISGPAVFCPGTSVQLFNGSTASSNQQWIKNGIELKDSVKRTLIVNQPGTYQLKSTTPNTKCYAYSTNFTVNESITTKPILSYQGTQSICQREIFPISISNFTSGQDQWYLSNGQLTDNNGKAQTYPARQAGNYKVIRTNQDRCRTVSDSVILKINNNPVLKLSQSLSTVCKNVRVDYSVSDTNSAGGSIYQWYINGKLIQSVTGKILSIDTLTKSSLIKVSVVSRGTCLKSTLVTDSVTTIIKKPFTINSEISSPSCYKKNGSIYLYPNNGYTILGGTLKSFSNTFLGEGNYTVSVRENSSFCVVDTSFTLTDFSKFDYSKTIVQPDCGKNNGSLRISPSNEYGFSGDTIKSIFTQNLDARKYTFFITLGNCTKKDSVFVIGKPSFKVSANIVQPTCSNAGSITFTTNPPVAFTVSKSLNKANNSGLDIGKYDVLITDNQSKCGIDTSFTLSNPNAVNIKLLKTDSVICRGNPIKPKYLNLQDTSELTFNWFKKGTLVSQKTSPSLKDSGTYVLTVKNLDGCTLKDSLNLMSFSADAGLDTSICIDNGKISVKAILNDNLAKGNWSSVGFATVNFPDSMKTTVSNLQPFGADKGQDANRFVWSVTKAGCTETDTAKIYYAKVVISVTDRDSVIAGEELKLPVTKNDKYSLGDKLKVNYDSIRPESPFESIEILGDTLVKFKTKVTIPGKDSIYYTLSNQCGVSSTAKVIVLVKNSPPIPLSFNKTVKQGTIFEFVIPLSALDRNKNINKSTIFLIKSTSGVSPTWMIDTINSNVIFKIDYTTIPGYHGNDNVQFRICDLLSVTEADCRVLNFDLTVEGGSLIVYNAVSPNGDNKNDFLLIENITLGNKVSVKIFNRWGDVVYSEDDYNNTTRRFDGGNLPDGTYYYAIEQSNGEKLPNSYLVLQR